MDEMEMAGMVGCKLLKIARNGWKWQKKAENS